MTELAKHIELLLQDNDCVVIPGFGGLVAYRSSAKRSEEGAHTFLPPLRALAFNPKLEINDGLLVQSYMQTLQLSFDDALKEVEGEVELLIRNLHHTGTAEFPNIGAFHYMAGGMYEFVPARPALTTPGLYGLEPVDLVPLSRRNRLHKSTGKRRFRTVRAVLRYTGAAAAGITLFFFLSDPVENTRVDEHNYAFLFPSELFSRPAATPLVADSETELPASKPDAEPALEIKPETKPDVKPATTPEIVPATQPRQASIETAAPAAVRAGRYHIIVMGGVTRATAENRAKQLRQNGYPQANVLTGEGKIRVSISSFPTREKATDALQELRKDQAYKDAWLHEIG